MTYAPVLGYEQNGERIPWSTKLGGYFERPRSSAASRRSTCRRRSSRRRSKLDPNVPAVFVTTHDIIGGNSGSPVVDRRGEFVGIVFDGNLQNLPNRFVYTDAQARALSVDARAILETLRKVYPAAHLAQELESGKR